LVIQDLEFFFGIGGLCRWTGGIPFAASEDQDLRFS
jgi:hypothetical protein